MARYGLNTKAIRPSARGVFLSGMFSVMSVIVYTAASNYENLGNDLHFVVNQGEVVKVQGEGIGVAWGIKSSIERVPRGKYH